MFKTKTKTKKENEHLKIENKILNDEIKVLRQKLKEYEDDRDNTLSGILKDFDYAIIVDHFQTKLFNAGRWEDKVRSIEFSHNSYAVEIPTLKIEK